MGMEPLAQTLREEAKAPSKYRAAPANLKVRRRENKHPPAEILRPARRQAARRLPIPWGTRNSERISAFFQQAMRMLYLIRNHRSQSL